jgi:hypothetical protein
LPFEIEGILDHSNNCTVFNLSIGQWSKNANYTISMLFNYLRKTLPSLKVLPRVLYLQGDNAGKEMKNRYMMAFCAFLVDRRVFETITLSCLPAGHTHIDLDQIFSRLAKPFFEACVQTVREFEEHCRCYVQGVRINWETAVYDWASWFTPFMHRFKGHKDPLAFHFHRCPYTGQVKVEVFGEHPITPTPGKGDAILLQSPPGIPHRVQPQPLSTKVYSDTMDALHTLSGAENLVTEYKAFISTQTTQVFFASSF